MFYFHNKWSTGQPALFIVFCSSSAYSSAGKQVSTTPFPFYPFSPTIESEPFQSTLPQDISFFPSPSKVNHFNLTLPSLPTFQFSYEPLSIFSSKTCILAFSATNLHTSFSFSLLLQFHCISSSPNHFTLHLHTVSTPLFNSFIKSLPYYHSHASLFSCVVIIHMPQTSTLTHSPSFHVLIRSYISLLSLSLHTTIHLKLFFVTRHIIHRSLLLFLSDI